MCMQENVFPIHIANKGFRSRMYKDPLEMNKVTVNKNVGKEFEQITKEENQVANKLLKKRSAP